MMEPGWMYDPTELVIYVQADSASEALESALENVDAKHSIGLSVEPVGADGDCGEFNVRVTYA